ncbi:MAG: hypothetical protein KGZ58_04965 [Ignavibacteriales bacterium]|nr:hypothetical protein [Ignavibacteriales bacterium]
MSDVRSQKENKKFLLLLLLIAHYSLFMFFIGCEKTPTERIDDNSKPPFLLSATTDADSINVDFDTLYTVSPDSGKTFTLSLPVVAIARDSQGGGSISSLHFTIFKPRSSSVVKSGVLHRDSTNFDSAWFSSVVTFRMKRTEPGIYRFEFYAEDNARWKSNAVSVPLLITRKNSPPILGLPTLQRHTPIGSDSSFITISLSVTDSNGIENVQNVLVRPQNAVDSSFQLMYDDGLYEHRDIFPGDGIFSTVFWITPVDSINKVVLKFFAIDFTGDTSNIVHRSLQNQLPAILFANIFPDSARIPTSGSIPILFSATVSDSDGLGDIDEVYFRRIYSPDTSYFHFPLFDDGEIASGDSVANDGTYSIILPLSSSATVGSKQYRFFVRDKFGAIDSSGTRFLYLHN